MTRIGSLLILWCMVCSLCIGEEVVLLTSIDDLGNRKRFKSSDSALLEEPSWQPTKNDIPLSIDKVVAKVLVWVNALQVENNILWEIETITLQRTRRRQGADKWYYYVTLKGQFVSRDVEDSSKDVRVSKEESVIVLLSGKIVEGSPEGRERK